MICPACRNMMIIIEHEKIELDYCPNCAGVWFDSGELGLLMNSLGRETAGLPLRGLLSLPESPTAEEKRRCPACRKAMRKVGIGKPDIIIDACPQNDGIWFDGGEVAQVIEQCASSSDAGPTAQQDVMRFLTKIFGRKSKPAHQEV